jgi:hypothetical protein
MNRQLQIARNTAVVELKDLGFSAKEVAGFQKTLKCPRCGTDFTNIPPSGRWLAHFTNCNGKTTKQKH